MHLTENMIKIRAKVADIASVKSLNLVGRCLDDITVVKRMENVEILVFTANDINSLEGVEGCVALKELFLRKNNITDIKQLQILSKLPALVTLYMTENPLCEKLGKEYRAAILRQLPNLKNLDGVPVTEKELTAIGANYVKRKQPDSFDESQSSTSKNPPLFQQMIKSHHGRQMGELDSIRRSTQNLSDQGGEILQNIEHSTPSCYSERVVYHHPDMHQNHQRNFTDTCVHVNPTIELLVDSEPNSGRLLNAVLVRETKSPSIGALHDSGTQPNYAHDSSPSTFTHNVQQKMKSQRGRQIGGPGRVSLSSQNLPGQVGELLQEVEHSTTSRYSEPDVYHHPDNAQYHQRSQNRITDTSVDVNPTLELHVNSEPNSGCVLNGVPVRETKSTAIGALHVSGTQRNYVDNSPPSTFSHNPHVKQMMKSQRGRQIGGPGQVSLSSQNLSAQGGETHRYVEQNNVHRHLEKRVFCNPVSDRNVPLNQSNTTETFGHVKNLSAQGGETHRYVEQNNVHRHLEKRVLCNPVSDRNVPLNQSNASLEMPNNSHLLGGVSVSETELTAIGAIPANGTQSDYDNDSPPSNLTYYPHIQKMRQHGSEMDVPGPISRSSQNLDGQGGETHLYVDNSTPSRHSESQFYYRPDSDPNHHRSQCCATETYSGVNSPFELSQESEPINNYPHITYRDTDMSTLEENSQTQTDYTDQNIKSDFITEKMLCDDHHSPNCSLTQHDYQYDDRKGNSQQPVNDNYGIQMGVPGSTSRITQNLSGLYVEHNTPRRHSESDFYYRPHSDQNVPRSKSSVSETHDCLIPMLELSLDSDSFNGRRHIPYRETDLMYSEEDIGIVEETLCYSQHSSNFTDLGYQYHDMKDISQQPILGHFGSEMGAPGPISRGTRNLSERGEENPQYLEHSASRHHSESDLYNPPDSIGNHERSQTRVSDSFEQVNPPIELSLDAESNAVNGSRNSQSREVDLNSLPENFPTLGSCNSSCIKKFDSADRNIASDLAVAEKTLCNDHHSSNSARRGCDFHDVEESNQQCITSHYGSQMGGPDPIIRGTPTIPSDQGGENFRYGTHSPPRSHSESDLHYRLDSDRNHPCSQSCVTDNKLCHDHHSCNSCNALPTSHKGSNTSIHFSHRSVGGMDPVFSDMEERSEQFNMTHNASNNMSDSLNHKVERGSGDMERHNVLTPQNQPLSSARGGCQFGDVENVSEPPTTSRFSPSIPIESERRKVDIGHGGIVAIFRSSDFTPRKETLNSSRRAPHVGQNDRKPHSTMHVQEHIGGPSLADNQRLHREARHQANLVSATILLLKELDVTSLRAVHNELNCLLYEGSTG